GALDGQGAQTIGRAQRAVQVAFGVDGVGLAGADDQRGAGPEQCVEPLDEHVVGGGGVGEVPDLLDDDDGAVQPSAADPGQTLGDRFAGADPLGAGLDRGEVVRGQAVVDGHDPGLGPQATRGEGEEGPA